MNTYIESKLNPDGRTYDHSEVIDAHKNGAKIYSFQSFYKKWQKVESHPLFYIGTKYRAVIENKPVAEDDTLYMHALALSIRNKFQSGNAIPVERITLTRSEVNEVFPGLLK